MNLKKKMSLKKKIFVGFAIFFGLLIFISVSSFFALDHFVVRYEVEELEAKLKAETKASAYKYLEAFKQDIAVLKPKLEFLRSDYAHDAGPFLNPRTPWRFNEDRDLKVFQEYDLKHKNPNKFIINNQKIINLLEKFPEIFSTDDEKTFAEIDTDWLHSLREFDHWDIDKNSPLELYTREDGEFYPKPLYLQHFVEIHLIKSKNKNTQEATEAILDALHYGKLCLSTEDLIGALNFTFIMRKVKFAIDQRKDSIKIYENIGPWAALLDEAKRLKRVYSAINQFTRPLYVGLDMETLKNIYQEQLPETGICATVRETTETSWEKWVMISDITSKELEEYRQLILNNKNGCRFTWLKERTPPWVRLAHEPKSPYRFSLQLFPYSKRRWLLDIFFLLPYHYTVLYNESL